MRAGFVVFAAFEQPDPDGDGTADYLDTRLPVMI